jgi:SatD family (SatD)
MKAILTADIINSRKVSPNIWLPKLKETLLTIGEEFTTWEIFRGDSMQIIANPLEVLEIVVLLKSTIKQIPNLDIRIGIGIGTISYYSGKVTSSNGDAFMRSGKAFDTIGKNTLAIKTPWEEFDQTITIMLHLAALTMSNWKPAMAEIFKKQWENKQTKQTDIALQLHKKQSNVSFSLKKAGYEEIHHLANFYAQKIKKLCSL